MTFASTGVMIDGDDVAMSGNLTVNGFTSPVQLAVEFIGVDTDAYSSTKAGFEATTSISRKDFGVDFNVPLDGGRFLVGDKVDIVLSIQAAKA